MPFIIFESHHIAIAMSSSCAYPVLGLNPLLPGVDVSTTFFFILKTCRNILKHLVTKYKRWVVGKKETKITLSLSNDHIITFNDN